MNARAWRHALLALPLIVIAAALTLSFRLVSQIEWQSTPHWQLLFELSAAFIAAEVAAFALSRFGLEHRRLPLFIGLGFLGAAISDLIAALVSQGNYLTPLVGQTVGVMGVWTAGRFTMALFLLLGLLVQRRWPLAETARAEMGAAIVIGASVAFAFAQMALMVPSRSRPWQIIVGSMLAGALPGYWSLYRRLGGVTIAAALVTLVMGIFCEAYMAFSATLYDAWFNLSSVLRIASYFPLLIGLFVESVTLFRAQRRLTRELQVAQAELSEYSESLEAKVTERTRDLEARAKDLEAFAYTVSHDLKAPLRGVQTYAQFLLNDYATKLDERGLRYAESLRRAALSMKQLIDDLLEYSRLGRRETELAPVELRDIVNNVIEERQSQIEQGHVEVKVDLALPPLLADRAMLRQALGNLLDNAIKFSSHSTPPRVAVRGREENGQFVVSVSDNGVGFDMQHKEKIFEIFQRLHRQDEYEGTGIGLSVVKRAIEKHGGRVWAEAEQGRGATFTFTLPKPKETSK
jgi:signal transduction histidine kinase